MSTQVLVLPGLAEARHGEDRLNVPGLACPDLDQHMASRRQVAGGTGRDCAVGIKAVGSPYKRQAGIEVPHIGAQLRDFMCGDIGRI